VTGQAVLPLRLIIIITDTVIIIVFFNGLYDLVLWTSSKICTLPALEFCPPTSSVFSLQQ
jgi:hypothetical protein